MNRADELHAMAEGLRGLCIALIDKHNQAEGWLNSLIDKAGAAEALAEVRAQRAITREFLGRLRGLRTAGAEDGGAPMPEPRHPHGGPARGRGEGQPLSRDTEILKNPYSEARS